MKPDWFKMNPRKFLMDSKVDCMTNEELGATFRLLCRQWIDGYLPDDLTTLCRMARATDRNGGIGSVMGVVLEMFPKFPDGTLRNAYMEAARVEVLQSMAAKSKAGKASAEQRWGNRRITKAMQEQEQEQDSTARKTAPKKNTAIPVDFLPYLEDLSHRWPRTSVTKDGVRRVTILRPTDIWDKIQKNKQGDSEKTCVNAGLHYLDVQDGKYVIGMDNFFGRERKYTNFTVED